jgi:hypothetical protein
MYLLLLYTTCKHYYTLAYTHFAKVHMLESDVLLVCSHITLAGQGRYMCTYLTAIYYNSLIS